MKIKVKTIKPMKVAYIDHTGEYDKIPWDNYMEKLYSWAKKHKVRPGFKGIGIYFEDPSTVKHSECRSQIAIPIKGNATSDDDVKIKEIESMEIAESKYYGPSDNIKEIYQEVSEWMDVNGYKWNGPSMEIYSRKPKVKGGKTFLYMIVQIPIKRK